MTNGWKQSDNKTEDSKLNSNHKDNKVRQETTRAQNKRDQRKTEKKRKSKETKNKNHAENIQQQTECWRTMKKLLHRSWIIVLSLSDMPGFVKQKALL